METQGKGGFPTSFNGLGRGRGKANFTCQIFFFKYNHLSTKCRDRFNKNFIQNPLAQGFSPS